MKPMIRWLRWAAVLGLVYSAWGGLVYDLLLLSPSFLVVAPGATIAPRARLTTAIVLAAAQAALAFRNHVLAAGGPWWSWTINYRHFTLEALGAVLGVVCIFWWERARASTASVPPSQSSLSEPPPPSAGKP